MSDYAAFYKGLSKAYQMRAAEERVENTWLWDKLIFIVGEIASSELDGSNITELRRAAFELADEMKKRLERASG